MTQARQQTTTYSFLIDGLVVQYSHENIGQAFREAKADYPNSTIEKV